MADDWKQMLDPPPGGLPRLIGAIQAEPAASGYRYPLALAATAMVLVGIVIGHRDIPARNLDAALKSALHGRGRVYVENGAALELPTTRADVRMFVVAQIPPADD